jgi:aldehyde dehydrogenase (NAD+)
MFVFGNHLKKTPCGIACQNIIAEVIKITSRRISCLINGDYKVGEMMTNDKRVPLISATGSTRMGKIVAKLCRASWKIIIELGGIMLSL